MSDFPMLLKARAEQLEDQAVKISKQVADLKKNKGDKKQIAALEKQYADVVKACVSQINKDIKIAGNGMKKVEADLDAAVGAASKRLTEARTGLKNYRAKKVEAHLKPCAGLERDVERLAKRGTDLMDDFAVSWNQYREANFPGIPDKLLVDYKKIRAAIIDRTMVWRTKQQKLLGFAAEASQLETAALEASQDFETDTDNRLVQAKELLTTVQQVIKQNSSKNNPETISGGLRQFQAWIKQPYDRFAVSYEVRKKNYKALTATAQAANQTLSSLKRSVTNGKSIFTAQDLKDPRIAAVMKDVDATFSAFESSVKENLKALPEIAKILTQADKRMKLKQ